MLVAASCAAALAGCGSTLESQPIAPSSLESFIAVREYPVYWLGNSFHGLSVSEVQRDRGGAYSVQYGNCARGGQATCLAPLAVVTSPENGFVAHGANAVRAATVRGVRALTSESGRTVELATGTVVVSIHADSAPLAAAAAHAMVPINDVGLPAGRLARALPATRFSSEPLPTQLQTSVSTSR
jgi:hypothetical protein